MFTINEEVKNFITTLAKSVFELTGEDMTVKIFNAIKAYVEGAEKAKIIKEIAGDLNLQQYIQIWPKISEYKEWAYYYAVMVKDLYPSMAKYYEETFRWRVFTPNGSKFSLTRANLLQLTGTLNKNCFTLSNVRNKWELLGNLSCDGNYNPSELYQAYTKGDWVVVIDDYTSYEFYDILQEMFTKGYYNFEAGGIKNMASSTIIISNVLKAPGVISESEALKMLLVKYNEGATESKYIEDLPLEEVENLYDMITATKINTHAIIAGFVTDVMSAINS